MTIKVDGKEYIINECTYAERRELHKLNAMTWWEGKMDVDAYYAVLERVGEIAGLGEVEFQGMEMPDIDKVLQAVFLEYLGIDPAKKDSGG
jgi:hypothetical protein|tara:strand:+ start:4427 stop:4699 length:273 start_codon:yes stop_codon:yes gene_type:complete